MYTRLIAFLLVSLVFGLGVPWAGEAHSFGLERHFKAAASRFLPGIDHRWLIAQARAESSMDPEAVSSVGALGLMQLMPGTSREVSKALGLPDEPLNPRIAIMLGAAYDARMMSIWSDPRPDLERWRLALASYNAGAGHIIQAQKLARRAGGCTQTWSCIAPHLDLVTGRHAKETKTYVRRIEKFYRASLVKALK